MPDYKSAYEELFTGSHANPNWMDKLPDAAKDLLGTSGSGIPFPYGGEKENEAFISKHGPEKAVDALNALISQQKVREGKADEVNASIIRDSWKRNEAYRDEILSRQGY